MTISTYQSTSWIDFLTAASARALEVAAEDVAAMRAGLPVGFLKHLGTAARLNAIGSNGDAGAEPVPGGVDGEYGSAGMDGVAARFRTELAAHLETFVQILAEEVDRTVDLMALDFMGARLPPGGAPGRVHRAMYQAAAAAAAAVAATSAEDSDDDNESGDGSGGGSGGGSHDGNDGNGNSAGGHSSSIAPEQLKSVRLCARDHIRFFVEEVEADLGEEEDGDEGEGDTVQLLGVLHSLGNDPAGHMMASGMPDLSQFVHGLPVSVFGALLEVSAASPAPVDVADLVDRHPEAGGDGVLRHALARLVDAHVLDAV